jgi:hypothetical protein
VLVGNNGKNIDDKPLDFGVPLFSDPELWKEARELRWDTSGTATNGMRRTSTRFKAWFHPKEVWGTSWMILTYYAPLKGYTRVGISRIIHLMNWDFP